MSFRPLIALMLPFGLAACMEEPEVSGAVYFADNCVACHGADGTGNGPLADGLPRPPADLTRISARHGGEFPRDYVMTVIDGYARDGRHADIMPEFGDGDLGELVIVDNGDGTGTPVPVMLLALADYLETIQQ
jgi:mono/diheme cytochrome c family protein